MNIYVYSCAVSTFRYDIFELKWVEVRIYDIIMRTHVKSENSYTLGICVCVCVSVIYVGGSVCVCVWG